VIGPVLTQAIADGVSIDYSTFMHQMSIYRTFSDYELFFRDRDPQIAQKMVNIWVETGIREIKEKQAKGELPVYLTINLGSLAELPLSPTYSQTNSYVLSGSIIGLVIGIAVTSLSFTTRFQKRAASKNKNIKGS
jgi:hypothetical protein